jgi:hypothetical protein
MSIYSNNMKNQLKSCKTILIPINHGFTYRYLIQSEVFSELLIKCKLIVLLVRDPTDKFYEKVRDFSNVVIDDYRLSACQNYVNKSPIQSWFRLLTTFTLNNSYNIVSVDDFYKAYLTDVNNKRFSRQVERTWLKYMLHVIARIILKCAVYICRRSLFFRKTVIQILNYCFTPDIHRDIFEKYNPDILLVTSLGIVNYDQLFMRQASAFGAKCIVTILSWDNTSTKGMPGAKTDHVIAWTSIMQNELITLNDMPSDKISVGGIPHFDKYYVQQSFMVKTDLFDHLGLDKTKKLLFFATKSPNSYANNLHIAETILKSIESGIIDKDCQLLIRMHPIYYRTKDGIRTFESSLKEFHTLSKKYNNLYVNEPTIMTNSLDYSMPEDDIKLLGSILKHSDIVINIFSTINIEASIVDTPIINISYEYSITKQLEKARFNISLDERQSHNQRIVKSGGVTMVYNDNELVVAIDKYLLNPQIMLMEENIFVKLKRGHILGMQGRELRKL